MDKSEIKTTLCIALRCVKSLDESIGATRSAAADLERVGRLSNLAVDLEVEHAQGKIAKLENVRAELIEEITHKAVGLGFIPGDRSRESAMELSRWLGCE